MSPSPGRGGTRGASGENSRDPPQGALMMRASTRRVRIGLRVCAIVAAGLSIASSPAKDIFGKDVVGPTGFVTTRDGTAIAVSVRIPKPFVKGRRYPASRDMASYAGGHAAG